MSWSIIAVEGTDPRLCAAAAETLRSIGVDVASVFQIEHTTIRLQDERDGSPSIVEFQVGSEGLGYHLNRCVEINGELDTSIRWFLVVGGEYDAVLSRPEIAEAVKRATETRQLVLGFAVDDMQPSTRQLLGFLNPYRHGLLSAGAGGIMILNKELWNSVHGFREDIGGWGTEVHFALDCLTAGRKTWTMPWSAGQNRVLSQKSNYLVATLVAFGTYGRNRSVLTKIIGLSRTISVGFLASTGAISRSLSQAREILRTRRFLESGK